MSTKSPPQQNELVAFKNELGNLINTLETRKQHIPKTTGKRPKDDKPIKKTIHTRQEGQNHL